MCFSYNVSYGGSNGSGSESITRRIIVTVSRASITQIPRRQAGRTSKVGRIIDIDLAGSRSTLSNIGTPIPTSARKWVTVLITDCSEDVAILTLVDLADPERTTDNPSSEFLLPNPDRMSGRLKNRFPADWRTVFQQKLELRRIGNGNFPFQLYKSEGRIDPLPLKCGTVQIQGRPIFVTRATNRAVHR